MIKPDRYTFHSFRIVVAASLLLANAAWSEDSALPEVHQSGDISYISGGIGSDESKAIKSEAPKYALTLNFIVRIDGHDSFDAPDELTILKADGSPVLDIKPDGPYLLLDLPPGTYKITAGSADQSSTQTVQIVRGAHKQITFRLAPTKPQSQS
jgi:hypothetical protein